MTARDKLSDIQRFISKFKGEDHLTIEYESRSKYAEKLMYFYMGVEVASIDCNRMPFYKKNRGETYKAHSSDLGKRILLLLEHASQSRVIGWDEEYALILKQSPIMKLTYDAFVAATTPNGEDVPRIGFVNGVIYSQRSFSYACGKAADEVVDGLNSFVLQLKEALNKYELREDVKNFYRNSNDRYLKLMKVATQAWDENCKNVLIRIDWGFYKKNPPMPPRLKNEDEINADFMLVDSKRKLMLKRLKKMYGDDISFYAWKIECGFDKGLHIHWLIALNGSKHKDAWFHAKEIVADWNANVCDETCYAWNVCDLYKNKTNDKYLRNLDYRDPELPNILNTYVSYLTKLDVTMKLRAPNGYRSFGCSKLKNLSEKKPGPERKGVNSLQGWAKK